MNLIEKILKRKPKSFSKLEKKRVEELSTEELVGVLRDRKPFGFRYLRMDPGDKWVWLVNGEPFVTGNVLEEQPPVEVFMLGQSGDEDKRTAKIRDRKGL